MKSDGSVFNIAHKPKDKGKVGPRIGHEDPGRGE
jgi:hypothetical protein